MWQVKVVPHPRKLYGIEGQADRRAEGIYDKMQNVGAHEVVVEHPSHDLILSRLSADHIALVLQAYVVRLVDLKRDPRFRYISVFRDQGLQAGQDLSHPHSQITAMPFIPRHVVYELRSSHQHFEMKERCLFCDIIQQELSRRYGWLLQTIALWPSAHLPPEFRTKPGCCPSSIMLLLRRIWSRRSGGSTWRVFSRMFSSNWIAWHQPITWCSIVVPTRRQGQMPRATGNRWPKTITGISRFCQSSPPDRSLTA